MAIFSALLLAFLCAALPAAAEMPKVSLQEAETLALMRNHTLKAAAYEQAAAHSDVSASRSYYFPRVSVEEGFNVSNSPSQAFMMKLNQGRFVQPDFAPSVLNHPPPRDNFRTSLSIEQTLYDRSIGLGVDLGAAEERAKSLTLERSREMVAFQVFSAYLAVRTAHAYLDAAALGVKDAREHLRLAKVRNEAGVGLKSDELRAGTFLAEMELAQIAAANGLTLARLRLAQVTGASAGEQLEIDGELPLFAPPAKQAELMTAALLSRHDLRGVSLSLEKAELGVRMANSAWWPRAFAMASYELNGRDLPFGNDNDAWQVGVGLRWEIFDGMRRYARKESASALRNAAAEHLAGYRQEVSLEVLESVLRCEEAASRREVARGALAQAEEGARLISRRFENAISPQVELLDAQAALNRARANLIESESSYSLASGRTYYVSGTFLKEVMK